MWLQKRRLEGDAEPALVEPVRKKRGKGKASSSTLTTLRFKQRNFCDAFLPPAFLDLD